VALGRKKLSVLLLASGALVFFNVFLLSVSSDAQTSGGGSTGAEPNVQARVTPSQSSAVAGGASAKSSREQQRRNVVRNTIPRRRLPPTGGLPVSVVVSGFVLTGVGLLGLGLVVRRRR
jgi:hypothetical protein